MPSYAILSENKYLKRKIHLLLSEEGDFSLAEEGDADIIIADTDTVTAPPGALTVSKNPERQADIILPLPLAELKARLVRREAENEIVLFGKDSSLTLGGKIHRLTELEFSLFSLLAERGGFVPREEILERVWQGRADAGIINVYIHYLRQKLEGGGEKIIISSRREGYRISEKYKLREAKNEG